MWDSGPITEDSGGSDNAPGAGWLVACDQRLTIFADAADAAAMQRAGELMPSNAELLRLARRKLPPEYYDEKW
jgi:hypothetical protein